MHATTALLKAERRPASEPAESCHPIIDLEHLQRYTLGDRKLEGEVLQLFADHLPRTLKTLQDSPIGRDWAMAAHTLKGSARAIGAWQLATVAERGEKLAASQAAATDRDAVLRQIENLAEETLGFIKARHSA